MVDKMLISNSDLMNLLAIYDTKEIIIQVALFGNKSYILVLYKTGNNWRSIKYSVFNTEIEAIQKAHELKAVLNDYYEPTIIKYHVTQ